MAQARKKKNEKYLYTSSQTHKENILLPSTFKGNSYEFLYRNYKTKQILEMSSVLSSAISPAATFSNRFALKTLFCSDSVQIKPSLRVPFHMLEEVMSFSSVVFYICFTMILTLSVKQ